MSPRAKRIITPIVSAIVVALAALLSFAGTALAARAASPDDGSLIDLAVPVAHALQSGQPALACALALVLMTALARRYLGNRWAWLNTDTGGTALVLIGSFGGAAAAAMTGGAAVSLGLAWQALAVAVSAAGGYAMIKRLVIEPLLRPLGKRFPWLQPVLAVILWVFDKPDPVAAAVADGERAVKKTPPTGTGIIGAARDLK